MRQNRPPLLKLQRAFTLIELLITVTVLGVLMAIALPNLRDFVVSNRLSSQVNGFVGLLNYARSEAIVRNQPVLVCARITGEDGCSDTQSWANLETQVFVDVNGDNVWSAGDILLKRIAALDLTGSETVFRKGTAADPNFINFGASGLAMNTHKFDLHAINAANSAYQVTYGRTICITRPGRATVSSLNLLGTCAGF